MSLSKWLKSYRASKRWQRELNAFRKGGYKPWTAGYETYKWDNIEKVISSSASFYEMLGTERFGYRIDERIVEYGWFFEKLTTGPAMMLDAGSALNHRITVDHEKIKNKKLFISTLAPEGTAFWKLGISYVFEDLRSTCFREKVFDCIGCISTIEHIGLDNTFFYTRDQSKNENSPEDYLPLVDILYSLLKPGGSLFLTFPFGKAKNHGWFQVFDAAMVSSLVQRFQPLRHTEEIFQYSGDRWHLSSREEAKDAACFDINVQKTYDPDYAAFSRAVACLELVR
ncbi:conserved hypothetical protein [Syntrophobacter sp. SbD1]|nr:conserved hypothetical protein [Syntrophobacter sp. SbD1]